MNAAERVAGFIEFQKSQGVTYATAEAAKAAFLKVRESANKKLRAMGLDELLIDGLGDE